MINKLNNDIKLLQISHYVGLKGLGGVQKNFVEYIKCDLIQNRHSIHTVFTNGSVDSQYELPINVHNIKNIRNLFSLILNIVSPKKIVHFYNNLSSLKVALLLLFIPTSNLIFHERGTAWNLSSNYGFLIRFISWKSDLILANSRATKTLLVKKFYIHEEKIKVIHNGVNTKLLNSNILQNKINNVFNVGFIGRLDSPKGVHILIEAMNYLKDKKIKLIIAGDGPLKEKLLEESENLSNITFIGRVNNPYDFFERINLLVVPSIREPLGIVCLEAGVCKVPVLGSNIDGIPEMISDFDTGELITPSEPVRIYEVINSLPLPEFVVDPSNQKLIRPMQINPKELADKILSLSAKPKTLVKYADQMYQNVLDNFSIENYSSKLHQIYLDLVRVK